MTAELLFVGTELLMGQVLNTNAQYISRRLQAMGVSCYYQTTLGDNFDRLVTMYRQALSRADIVITTGGIGPTVDDITKKAAAKAVGKDLVFNQTAFAMVEKRFEALGRQMTENNRQQACFTPDSLLLVNHHGTAPGAQVPAGDDKFIFHLPGPPHEMVPMFEEYLIPFFEQRSQKAFKSRYIRIVNIGESEVDFIISNLEEGENPSLSPYASPGEVVLRATAYADTGDEAEKMLLPLINQVKEKLGSNIYRIDEDDRGSLEETVLGLAKEKCKTISVAESLTAGMIGAALASVPGASKVFSGGMITYNNQMKEKLLKVPSEILSTYGAVSSQCAQAMAQGVKNQTGSDVALGVTGVAGPGSDEDGNPQGLVYIGVAYGDKSEFRQFRFTGSRQHIRKLTTIHGLNILRMILLNEQ